MTNSCLKLSRAIGVLGSVTFAAVVSQASLSFADWPQFRGPNASSQSLESTLPSSFNGESGANIAWQVPMPGKSVGGAIVVGDQVISTSSAGMDERRIYVTSVSKEDGKRIWQQEFVARGRPFCHPTSANAAPTPCSDGQHVYAFYSSNDLACISLKGELVWYRSLTSDFPKAYNDTGMSSSPVVSDGVVVVQIECQGESFAAGIDAATGQTVWRKERDRSANWASPCLVRNPEGKSILLLQCGKSLDAFDIQSGDTLWSLELSCSSIPSAMGDNGRIYAPAKGITAIDLASDNQKPQIGWDSNQLNCGQSSPLIYKDKILVLNRSVLVAGDSQSGEVAWRVRLPDAGTIWSTPVIAKDQLFVFADTGKCFVVDLSQGEGKLTETCELGEAVLGSPAIDGDAMFVRSNSKLWKIAKTN